MRLQLALNVDDIDQAVEFYSKLFATEPAKRKPGYANFAVENPPLKLVLFEVKGAEERLNHLGVEVFEAEEVTAATDRLKAAGLADHVEDEATCRELFGDDEKRLTALRVKGATLCGDVHPLQARGRAGWLTPVPGGVGPLTIAMLLKNTLDAAWRSQGQA